MIRFVSSVLALSFLLAVPATFAQGSSPDGVVRSFYRYSNARSATFNKRHVEIRKSWYTQELYKAFLNQLSQDEAYLKKNPTDKPYFGDGLTFRPLDEPCEVGDRSHKRIQSVGRTETVRNRATVDVTFAYPKSCTLNLQPIVFQVHLQKVAGKWLIDDLTYGRGASLKGDMMKEKYN